MDGWEGTIFVSHAHHRFHPHPQSTIFTNSENNIMNQIQEIWKKKKTKNIISMVPLYIKVMIHILASVDIIGTWIKYYSIK
jgi:hypothetical protein